MTAVPLSGIEILHHAASQAARLVPAYQYLVCTAEAAHTIARLAETGVRCEKYVGVLRRDLNRALDRLPKKGRPTVRCFTFAALAGLDHVEESLAASDGGMAAARLRYVAKWVRDAATELDGGAGRLQP